MSRLNLRAGVLAWPRVTQSLRLDLPTSEEREEIKRLKRENFELRRASEIL
jgi:hypothetical protein